MIFLRSIYLMGWVGLLVFSIMDCCCVEVPVVSSTNVFIRIMSANLTGSSQKYEAPAIRIFQGVKPDIIAIQEFNYGNNTSNDIRYFVNTAFGSNYYYYREDNAVYTIPNGIISRYPIIGAGSWDDPEIPDRGFAWAVIDIPGETNLTVISVHLKASSSDAGRRVVEAITLKSLILTNVNTEYYVVVGDLNTASTNEQSLTILRSFLVDEPVPVDTFGDPDTNLNRNERYDYILACPSFSRLMTSTLLGTHVFGNGLVFDSRTYPYLNEVAPIQKTDSGTAQHMAVLKDYKVTYAITNFIWVESPKMHLGRNLKISWSGVGVSNVEWKIMFSSNLIDWHVLTNVASSSDSIFITNINERMFFRLKNP